MTNRLPVPLILGTAILSAYCGHILAQSSEPRRWVDSYASYKSSIIERREAARRACEGKLHGILQAIDTNSACKEDSDCALLSHEPFGRTIPIRAEGANTLLAEMKFFHEHCVGNTLQNSYSDSFVHAPVCAQQRCMVKTSVRK